MTLGELLAISEMNAEDVTPVDSNGNEYSITQEQLEESGGELRSTMMRGSPLRSGSPQLTTLINPSDRSETTIGDLPATVQLQSSDVLAIEVNGTTYKIAADTLSEGLADLGGYGIKSISLNGTATTPDENKNVDITLAALNGLSLAGGTMTGTIKLPLNLYRANGGGINCQNADIINVNVLSTADVADSFGEGIQFYRDGSVWDTMTANGGNFYFGAGRTNQALTAANSTANIYAARFYGAVTGNVTGNCSGSSGSCTGAANSARCVSYTISDLDYTKSNMGVTSNWNKDILWYGDKSGTGLMRLHYTAEASTGKSVVNLQVRAVKSDNSIGDYLGITMYGNRNNTISYSVSNPAGFRSAISAYSTGGGTLTGHITISPSTTTAGYQTTQLTGGKTNNSTSSDSTYSYITYAGTWCRMYMQNRYKQTKTSDSTVTWVPARFFFRQWSATASSGTHLDYYETYFLPATTDGRTTNGSYSILTTKSLVTVAQGGTGVSSANANVVFAGPSSGSAAAPSFRALAAADLPTVTVAKGGTGATTALAARTNLQAALGKYTTGEVDTGGTWVGGQKIYRYTFTYTTTATGDVTTDKTLPRTPGTVLDFGGAYKDANDNNWRPMTFISYKNLGWGCAYCLVGTTIHIYIGGSNSTQTKTFVGWIDYTA